jgi:hypothetical protein
VYGIPANSRRSTVARNASSSARSSEPGSFAWIPRPIERWSRFGNIQAMTFRFEIGLR